MFSAEDIQRQVTIAVIVAVKEASLLVSMQRQVGHIQVQNNALGWLRMGFQEHFHQQSIYGFGFIRDFLIPIRLGLAQLQSVQRAFAS